MTGMIALIGEQPIPNLLVIRECRPTEAVFLYTDRTQKVAERLKALVERRDNIPVHLLPTDPYDIPRIRADLERFLKKRGGTASAWLFNLTGGTKPMAMAAYALAAARGAPFVYLESERGKSLLYRYRFVRYWFVGRRAVRDSIKELPELITIEDYLCAHVDCYDLKRESRRRESDLGFQFERALEAALRGVVDEVQRGVLLGGALELDLVVRRKNQVGVIQAKTGKKARTKEGLDQLAACAREYLGTYTRKILAVNQRWDQTLENLRELAKAWGITVVELPSFREESPTLSPEDQQALRETVQQALGG